VDYKSGRIVFVQAVALDMSARGMDDAGIRRIDAPRAVMTTRAARSAH
jgi:hypothetical protein